MSIWKGSIFRLVPLTLLVGLLIVSGCGRSTETTDSPEALAMTDSDLADSIKAKIDSDEKLRAANLDIDANASENRATISGTVSSEALRTRAIELAHSAKQGMILESKIDVKPPDVARKEWTEDYSRTAAGDSVSDSLDDTWIHTKIVAKLIGDSDVTARKINVDVNDNVVTLRGTVPTEGERNEAVRIARDTDGVKRVVNQLKVGPS